jgi:hypothetical protein
MIPAEFRPISGIPAEIPGKNPTIPAISKERSDTVSNFLLLTDVIYSRANSGKIRKMDPKVGKRPKKTQKTLVSLKRN